MERINSKVNGWFLPQVQRQYAWGMRYESEAYICLLLDSLFRGYPIGGLVVWETSKPIPHREFLGDYTSGQIGKLTDEGRWGAHKSLVYDGQQRLQTLHSVLYHSFNQRVLWFNLLFDRQKSDSEDTGFHFRSKGSEVPTDCISMVRLFSLADDPRTKESLKSHFTNAVPRTEEQALIIKTNIDELWKIFVERHVKSIAYFPVQSDNEDIVNEIFRRLNTGGIALTQIELVLAKVKAKHPEFEQDLHAKSVELKGCSGGFEFTAEEILQFIFLQIYGSVKVDVSRVKPGDAEKFHEQLSDASIALHELFEGYLWGLFKINNGVITPRRLALLPIAAYVAQLAKSRRPYRIKELTQENIRSVTQYLILSQVNDWNTQTMVNAFAAKAKTAASIGENFPLKAIKEIALEKNRSGFLHYHQFVAQRWFALKILAPSRSYVFFDDKPEIDHIFPLNLADQKDDYQERVDILWNLQPMPAGVNNYKRARNPAEFFTSDDGGKYFGDYDFLPIRGATIWKDYRAFLRFRHKQMRRELQKRYQLKLVRLRGA